MPTWTGNGADNNWSTAGNWDTGVPTTTTNALFTGVGVNGNKNVTITAGASCTNIDFTGYSGTANFANTLNIRGTGVNLGTTATISGTGGITINTGATAASFTSNNRPWGMPIIYNQNGTGGFVHTYFNNWTVSNFTTNTVGGNPISAAASGGAVITVTGNLNISQAFTAPTLTFKVTGTSTIVSTPFSSATGNLTAIVQIDSGVNTVTLSSLNLSGSLIWVSGPMTVVGTLTIFGSTTLNLPAPILMSNIFQNVNTIITLLSEVNCNNFTYGSGGGSSVTLTGGFRMKIRGNFVFNCGGNSLGTGIISMIGTGTMSQVSSAIIQNSIETNTLGTITLSNLIFNATWTHTPTGTILAGSSTLTLYGGTLNTAGLNFFNIIIISNASIAINSLLNITSNLTLNGNATFTGISGWTCANLLCSAANSTIILQSGITYTTTTNVTMLGTNAQKITMRSDAPTVSYAIWTLQNPATQSMTYVNGQGVNSNAGMTIWSFGGVINTSLPALNWGLGAYQGTKAFTFVS